MNKFMEKVTGTAAKVSFQLAKNKPEILMVAGGVSIVAGTVLACRATLKIDNVIDEAEQKLERIETGRIDYDEEDYTTSDYNKDKCTVYVQTAADFIKLYGPSAIAISTGLACFLAAHNIMKQRYIALATAYTALDNAFKSYRQRVVEEHGEEADYMYRHGLVKEDLKIQTTDEEGNLKEETVTNYKYKGQPSVYAKFFDESSKEWNKNAMMNYSYLRGMQARFNDTLRIKGHVFLNEVYDALGIPRTPEGQVVGWSMYGDGDKEIDFGLYRDDDSVHAFINGYHNVVLLDFNVDGEMYESLRTETGVGCGFKPADEINHPDVYMCAMED